ncbi:MAG TPA: hypothetical protein VFY29_20035 [Terriglobia bacterium]|nr:hypothetical protein [Terriglobia bacterium]
MKNEPAFDLRAAHRYFSALCFNKAWDLIEKAGRTSEENEEMIRLSQASIWHWTQREDCARANLSIGYWQASRVHALVGNAGEARRYGDLCMEQSRGEAPFLMAYAHEALARAAQVAGNTTECSRHREEAERLAADLTDKDERALLEKDLETLR